MKWQYILAVLALAVVGGLFYLGTSSSGPGSKTQSIAGDTVGMESGEGFSERSRGGRQRGGERAEDRAACRNTLRLYHGPDLIWEKQSDAFAELPESASVEGSHQPDNPAVDLFVLASAMEGAVSVEVASCGGWITRYPLDRLESGERTFYISANRRGGFKLFSLDEGGREETIMRQVGRISVKRDGRGHRAGEDPDPV